MATEIDGNVPLPTKRNARRKKDEVIEDVVPQRKRQPKRYKRVPLSEADSFWRKA